MIQRLSHYCYVFLAALAVLGFCLPVCAESWPTYMKDNFRSGFTTDSMTLGTLDQQWAFIAKAAPVLAWPEPQANGSELSKVKFDDAYFTVAANGIVYFGTTGDNKVYALDAVDGDVLWSFCAGGAVRNAPTVDGDNIFFGTDDGYVYCLEADTGAEVWTYSTMATPLSRLGNGRMVSRQPVRTGVAVAGSYVYFGCGNFAQDGIAMVKLNKADGTVSSRNDSAGSGRDFTPQGYAALTASNIICPSARMRPTGFPLSDMTTSPYTFNNTTAPVPTKGYASGPRVMVAGSTAYVGTQNTIYGFTADTGARSSSNDWTSAKQLVVTDGTSPRHLYYKLKGLAIDGTGSTQVMGYNSSKTLQWTYTQTGLESIIVCGNYVIVGGLNKVYALDVADGSKDWEHDIDVRTGDERAIGLTIADSQLYVSTDKGDVLCFGNGTPVTPTTPSFSEPFANDDDYEDAAAAVVTKAGYTSSTKGYCLVTGSGMAPAIMGYNIAKRTGMQVYCVVADAQDAEDARAALDGSLLYGTQIVVDNYDAEAALRYPAYFANLIVHVSEENQTVEPDDDELLRMLRPSGGWLMYGPVSGTTAPDPPSASQTTWDAAGSADFESMPGLSGVRTWYVMDRDPLVGAGSWTHQYADAGNTGSSDDQWVRNSASYNLRILWYGAPGPGEANGKTFRSVAPLSHNGLVFHQGYNLSPERKYIICYDAYNGTRYWEWQNDDGLAGPARGYQASSPGNMACTDDYLFVAANTHCYRLDTDSGTNSETYAIPSDKSNNWGYVAVDTSSGLLIGAVNEANGKVADTLFAHDIATGNLIWRYDCASGDVIYQQTIAISEGRVFFVQSHSGVYDVVALELANSSNGTPNELWRRQNVDLTNIIDLTNPSNGEDGAMALAKNGVLLLGVVANSYSGYANANRSVLAMSIYDGTNLWASGKTAVGNKKRLLVMGNTLIAWPYGYNLSSGAQKMNGGTAWNLGSAGAHCGAVSASASLLFYRDGTTIWYDAWRLAKTTLANVRPGCWINIIPAGGVVVQPEIQYSCTCYYSLSCAMAYKSNAAPNTVPTTSITSPSDETQYATPPASITITANASDADSGDGDSITRVEFYEDGKYLGEDTTSAYSYNWSSPPVGNHVLTVKAYDNRGGCTKSANIDITILSGNTPPTVSWSSPSNGTRVNPAGQNITLAAIASDADGAITKVEFWANGTKVGEDTNNRDSTYSYTWTSVADNDYAVTAVAYDNGNPSLSATSSPAINLHVGPNHVPTVSITTNGTNFTAPASITIDATASDPEGIGITQVVFKEGNNTLYTDTLSPYSYTWNNVGVGDYTLTAVATDAESGTNTSNQIVVHVTSANTAPTVSITDPTAGQVKNGAFTITADAHDADGDGTITKVEFYEDGNYLADGTYTNSSYSYTWNSPPTGTQVLTAKAYDQATSTTSSGVSMRVNAPPTVSITAPSDEASYQAPATIDITASASDTDSTGISQVVFKEGGNTLFTDTQAPYSYSWNSVSAGDYALTAEATDTDGGVSVATIDVHVTSGGNTPPSVSLTSPTSGSVNVTNNLTLTATATDDVAITKVEFYADGTKIGEDTNNSDSIYSYNWSTVIGGSHTVYAKAFDSSTSTDSSAASITVWNYADIGAVGTTGSADFINGTTFDIHGAGAGIASTADAFHFVYMPMAGDCEIIAKVTGWADSGTYVGARAGVMIRSSLADNAKEFSSLYRRDTGVSRRHAARHYRASTTTSVVYYATNYDIGTPPKWFRLVRSGTACTAYWSTDGSTWTAVTSATTNTSISDGYIGLAVTSGNTASAKEALFTDVTVTQ